MPFSVTAKNAMLDSRTCDAIRLHSGDPGSAGTSNQLGAGLSAATFNAASSGVRALNADVTVTGLAASQSVTHFSVWQVSGAVFQGSAALTGDATANTDGDYTLKVVTTQLRIND